MSCPDKSQLFWHRHGGLPTRQQRAVDKHLSGCAACRAQYADLTCLAGTLSLLSKPGTPARAFAPLPASRAPLVVAACCTLIALSLLRLLPLIAPNVTLLPSDAAPTAPNPASCSCHSSSGTGPSPTGTPGASPVPSLVRATAPIQKECP